MVVLTPDKSKQNKITHVVLVLDRSTSMQPFRDQVIKVADNQIKHLANRSQAPGGHETRVTAYSFGNDVTCCIYDMDALRLPSMRQHYEIRGATALVDATLQAINDLAMTPEKYGEHSFLIIVITDGEENSSRTSGYELERRIKSLPGHWTLAALVPNQVGKHEAKRYGFPADNIAIWDATSEAGLEEAARKIKDATDRFLDARDKGVRGTTNLFGGVDQVNSRTIKAAALKPLSTDRYVLIPVAPQPPEKHGEPILIKEFVEGVNVHYQVGKAYYPLTKPERIQGNKALAVVEKKTAKVFVGDGVRDMLGLPDLEVRIKPDSNPDYHVYVQSNSTNRHLVVGTKLLLLR